LHYIDLTIAAWPSVTTDACILAAVLLTCNFGVVEHKNQSVKITTIRKIPLKNTTNRNITLEAALITFL